MRIARTARENLINDLTVYYNPDRTRGAISADTCQAALRRQDSVSIARYGRRAAGAELFLLDAVADDAMAEDVVQFWLVWCRIIRKMPQFSVFLDNMEIEPGDVIDITYPQLDNMSGYVCEVLKVKHVIGDAKRLDQLQIWAIENGARD